MFTFAPRTAQRFQSLGCVNESKSFLRFDHRPAQETRGLDQRVNRSGDIGLISRCSRDICRVRLRTKGARLWQHRFLRSATSFCLFSVDARSVIYFYITRRVGPTLISSAVKQCLITVILFYGTLTSSHSRTS